MTFRSDFPFRKLAVVFTVSIGLFGCSKNTEVASGTHYSAPEQKQRTWIQSMADLQRVLTPQMSTNEIIAHLGKPDREEIATEGVVWRYGVSPFPAGGEMDGAYVIGVVIGVTNGRLAEWGCAYRGAPVSSSHVLREETLSLSGKGNDPTSLKFYIVSSEPVDGGRFIDTKQLPKVGYVAATPSLLVSKLRKVTLAERSAVGAVNSNVWSFIIFLLPEDAAGLGSLTATNVGEQMLISIGDEPVVAARIASPLDTGNFEIECGNRLLMETIKNRLETIQQRRSDGTQ